MPEPAFSASAGAMHSPSLDDLRSALPPDGLLQRWLPAWAVPPAYGYVLAPALTSAVLAGHLDRDVVAGTLGSWALSYGIGVAADGALEQVVVCAGVWQLAAHLAAVAVTAHLRAAAATDLADEVSGVIDLMWSAWGTVTAPNTGRLSAGLALHRYVTARSRSLPPRTGVTELARCAIKTGRELPAAQHRLIHLMVQQPGQLRDATRELALDGHR